MHDTIIIKIGGGEGINLDHILDEFAELVRSGQRAILVHGGSHETNLIAERLGQPPRFITSPSGHTSRRTDRATLDIFNMVYCGKINKSIVERLRAHNADAVGLSGIDAGIWRGTRKDAIRSVEDGLTTIIRDDLSGRVEDVNVVFLKLLLDTGHTPVLTPPAITHDGIAINVDADRAAAATAAALGAAELLLLSNVPGVLRDHTDPASLITSISADNLETARDAAKGRMKNKILAAEEALTAGVPRVIIGSANGDHPIAAARNGAGTHFEGALA